MPHSFGYWLLTCFEAFGPPVKEFALGVSVVILDGAFVVQILKGVGASTVQWAIYKRCFKTLRNIHFLCSWSSGFSVQHMLGGEFKVSKGAKIRDWYNEVPHMTQDTKGKVTKSQLDTTNEHQQGKNEEMTPTSLSVHQLTVVPKNWEDFLWEDDNKLFLYLSNCCVSLT